MIQSANPYAPPAAVPPAESAQAKAATKGDGVRWGLLIVGLLFLIPVLPNLLKGSIADALADLALGAAGTGGFAFLTRCRRQRREFVAWLASHREEVLAGTGTYNGLPVTPGTKVRLFSVAISFLIVSFRFPSAFVLEHDPEAIWARVISSLVTLVLGWWGFPFGPIFSVIVLYRNARGGQTVTVGELLGG